MNIPAALVLQSIPFAGLAIAKSDNRDILILTYISAVGVMFSIIAIHDDQYGLSSIIGKAIEALQ